MVRAVLFDLFETLITESAARLPGVSSLGAELGCEEGAFRARWRACRPDVVVGRLSLREALRETVIGLGQRAEEATLRRICEDRVRAKGALFDPIEPEILGMVRALHRDGLRLGVVSNCFAEDVVAWSRCSLAPYFDCTMFSFEVGLAKPDPAIYFEATKRLEVDASEAWFVGDGMDDELAGAERAGLRPFRALWFLRRWAAFRESRCSAVSVPSVGELTSLLKQAG